MLLLQPPVLINLAKELKKMTFIFCNKSNHGKIAYKYISLFLRTPSIVLPHSHRYNQFSYHISFKKQTARFKCQQRI